MPEEMHAHSTITRIEIDQLTARIAKALYPDADIRHQPFERLGWPRLLRTAGSCPIFRLGLSAEVSSNGWWRMSASGIKRLRDGGRSVGQISMPVDSRWACISSGISR